MGDQREVSDAVLLRETTLGQAILSDNGSAESMLEASREYCNAGGSFAAKDSVTGETFVHLAVSKPEIYSRPDRVGCLYLLCCKADLNLKDHKGDTVLHKVVRHRGTHRMITCLMRCGADPSLKDKEGKTAENILRNDHPDGWEENLHWLQKFLPGIFQAVLTDSPDLQLVERLLKSWCRLCRVVNGESQWLKCQALRRKCSLGVVVLLEKYENTIELALAALAGKTIILQNWRKEDIMKNMDVDIKDSSYQYGYPDYPISPRPLLASVWETNNYGMVAELMLMHPDSRVLYKFEPEAHHRAKPLFFYLVDPKMRPADERIICCILEHSDMSARNTAGQTILFEAIQHNVSEALFSFMLQKGCDVAARDRYGRTVRDYSMELMKPQYVTLIDEHVSRMVLDANISCLESLVLKGYDHITDLDVVLKRKDPKSPLSSKGSKQLEDLLTDAPKKQEQTRKVFETMKCTSSVLCVRSLISKKLVVAQDRGGRTVLHHAIEHTQRKIVEHITSEYPQIINIPNNMGQTPLHYAHLFMYSDGTPELLIKKGARTDAKDVEGWIPSDYARKTIGDHCHDLMRQTVRDLELDLFLSVTNFDVAFLQAIRDGNKKHVEALATRLRDHGGFRRFNKALFECLDHKQEDIACTLIKLGFSTDVYKQYEMCGPDDPMCAMMECSHSMTSFRQHAEKVNATKVVQLIDDIAKGKVKLKGRGCCMGRCLRPSLPNPRTACSTSS